MAGGVDDSFNDLKSAELYDPARGTWATTGSMFLARIEHAMVTLQDGTVLVAGGDYDVTESEVYDPATGHWRTAGSMTDGRDYYVAVDTEVFDSTTQTWRLTGSLQQGRDSNTATLLQDGRVLVAGGEITGPPCDNEGGGCTTTVLASAELLSPTAGS
jgi:N-acetylneuraminic acid mutarotase